MELTSEQYGTLRTALINDATIQSLLNSSQYQAIADLYNLLAVPGFWAYRSAVPTGDIGVVVNYVAIANLSDLNGNRLRNFFALNPISFNGRADVKTFFDDVLSGSLGGQGQATRDALDLLLRRQVTKAERVFATGTGSVAAPGTLGASGELTAFDVDRAVNQGQ